ncbi:MAG: hypothetical protein ACJA2J_002192, partial [Candidatus Azotimanducaceae bacterium]
DVCCAVGNGGFIPIRALGGIALVSREPKNGLSSMRAPLRRAPLRRAPLRRVVP